jgi:flavodoxin
MNVGIFVFSNTGNTLAVAQKLKDSFTAKGQTVSLEQITAESNDPNTPAGKQLKDCPDTKPYDVLIFGNPVWAFSIPSVMKAYLSQVSSLEGKKVGCFVTQHFSKAWMGGNHTIKQMKSLCMAKGATIFATGVINWSNKAKEDQITKLIEKMTQI